VLVEIIPQARKDLRRLPAGDRRRLLERLEAYAAEPVAGHDVVSLKGAPGHFRLRSGDWRAIFQIVGEVVIVKRIRHRREVYR
jgi:mRNA interferase RelE/StbE